MTEEQKNEIIESGKDYFRTTIIPNHLKNLDSLHLKSFNINPFIINYLAAFLCGDTKPVSLAKALVYPRVIGTSINTSFGQNIQNFISQLATIAGTGSAIEGIDTVPFFGKLQSNRQGISCILRSGFLGTSHW